MWWLFILGVLGTIVCFIFLLVKQNKGYLFGLLGSIVLIIIAAIGLVSSGVSKLSSKMKKGFKEIEKTAEKWEEEMPKDEERLYQALFNKELGECVIFEESYRENNFTTDFYWAKIATCPEEMREILKKNSYEKERIQTQNLVVVGTPHLDWFQPKSLGKEIHHFTFRNESEKAYHEMFLSADSTQLFLNYQKLEVDFD